MNTVQVVVVTYSPGETLAGFLESLPASTSRPYQVVLADNGSTDGVPEEAAAEGSATLVRTGANLGYGAAANRGMATGNEPWVVVANPDIVWAPGALDELLAAAERWPRAGVLGPRVVNLDGSHYPSARALPSLVRGTGHALFGWWWPSNPWTRAYRQEDNKVAERECGWLSGSCMLLRREAVEAVGGFDESYFMFFEDVDICERIGKAGWLNVYVPSATVEHVGGHSWRDQPAVMLRAHHDSALQYLCRRYHKPWQAPLRFALRVGLGFRAWVAGRLAR